MISKEKKQFSYLLNLELWNSLKIVLPSVLLLMIIRAGMFVNSVGWRIKPLNRDFKGNIEGFVNTYGHIRVSQIYRNDVSTFMVSVFIVIAFIIFYSVFIWLKEWLGNNKTIYTLLILPVSRTTIILSKFVTCFIIFIMFGASQVISLLIDRLIFSIMVPKGIIMYESFIEIVLPEMSNGNFPIFIFSNNFIEMLLIILIVLAGISAIFLFILIERSYRLKGLIVSFIVSVFVPLVCIFYIPKKFHFFIDEFILFVIIVSFIYILGGFFINKYLLEKKVHV